MNNGFDLTTSSKFLTISGKVNSGNSNLSYITSSTNAPKGPSPSQDFNEVDFTQYLKNSCNHKTIKERMPFEFLPVDESFIHAKIYVADDSFAAIASANLTKTGMWERVEHIVIFDGGPDIQK